MVTLVSGDGARTLQGYGPADDYTLSLVPSVEVVAAVPPVQVQSNDMTVVVSVPSKTLTKSDVVATAGPGNPPVTFTSLSPSICSVDAAGHVSFVSAGTCLIEASGKTGRRVSPQTISAAGGAAVVDEVIAIVPGSLRAYLRAQQRAALAGVVAGAAAQRAHVNGNNYATNGGVVAMNGGSYGAVNPDNFLRAQAKPGFDALPLDALDAILSGPDGQVEWAAWISPHHYLTWLGHTGADGADWLNFASESKVKYSATAWTGTLCKLLPADWRAYIPSNYVPTPSYQNLEISAWVRLYNTYDNKADATAERRWVQPARIGTVNPFDAAQGLVEPDLRPYQRAAADNTMVHGGDSGSPVFCGINGNLVILSHTRAEFHVGAEHYADYIAEINAAMNALAAGAADPAAGTYTVQTVDLSGFPRYA